MPEQFRKATPPPSGRTPRSGKVDPPDAPERVESTEPDDDLSQYMVTPEDVAEAEVTSDLVLNSTVTTGDSERPGVYLSPDGSTGFTDGELAETPAGPQVNSADHELVRRLQHELAVAQARINGDARQVDNWSAGPPPRQVKDGDKILIHVRKDGFTANGRVWYMGQELEFTVGEQNYLDTCDRNGNSWLMRSEAEQLRAYGEVQFGFGPWPGQPFDHPRAAEAEQRRGRRAPTITQLTAESSLRK